MRISLAVAALMSASSLRADVVEQAVASARAASADTARLQRVQAVARAIAAEPDRFPYLLMCQGKMECRKDGSGALAGFTLISVDGTPKYVEYKDLKPDVSGNESRWRETDYRASLETGALASVSEADMRTRSSYVEGAAAAGRFTVNAYLAGMRVSSAAELRRALEAEEHKFKFGAYDRAKGSEFLARLEGDGRLEVTFRHDQDSESADNLRRLVLRRFTEETLAFGADDTLKSFMSRSLESRAAVRAPAAVDQTYFDALLKGSLPDF